MKLPDIFIKYKSHYAVDSSPTHNNIKMRTFFIDKTIVNRQKFVKRTKKQFVIVACLNIPTVLHAN